MFDIRQIDPKLLQALIQQEQGNTIGLPSIQQFEQVQKQPVNLTPADPTPKEQVLGALLDNVQKQPTNLTPADPTPKQSTSMFGSTQQQPVNLSPAAPTPKTPAPALPQGPEATAPISPYEQRIAELMEQRGWDRAKAEANQAYAISRGHDIDGDGAVTDSEFGSGYTSTANTDIDKQYAANGQGLGSVYITSQGETDKHNLSVSQRFEILQRANDALLGDDEEWGFEDGAHGQWGTYGGPGFSQTQERIDEIDLNRTGYGTNGLVGGDMNLGELYREANWRQADVVQGAKLGEIVDTPMGRYMVVNGMDGQLALKGLKGATHGGGNYFYRTVHEGYHMGINPNTGDVWFQQAPEIVELARQVAEAGGDLRTAMTSGLGSGDLGVWDQERIDKFNNGGSSGGMLGTSGSQTTWQQLLDPHNTVLNGLFGGRG